MTLGSPTSRRNACALVHEALRELDPGEAAMVAPFVEPFVEIAGGGELITLDRSRGAGRFGEGDLLMPVVARLVVEALRQGGAASVTAARVEEEARLVGSRKALARSGEVAQAIVGILARRPDAVAR